MMKNKKAYIIIILFLMICTLIGFRTQIFKTEIVDTNDLLNSFDQKRIAWGIGKDKDEAGQPIDCVKANLRYNKYHSMFVGPNANKIYLTFDNGYENGNTAPILDILKQNKVKAVFFVTGDYVLENDELVKRMIKEGHIVGNHTYKHHSFIKISKEKVRSEIMELDKLVYDKYKYKMFLVRPPKGEFDEECLMIADELDYQSVLWSFAYYDYNENDQMSKDQALGKLLKGLHPGSIYLLHSISKTNVEVLNDFIIKAQAQGYIFSGYDLYNNQVNLIESGSSKDE